MTSERKMASNRKNEWLENSKKNIKTITQQAHNLYTKLDLGHNYVTSYMNVYTTLLQRL